MTSPVTQGAHHVGLSVPDLEAATEFFVNALRFREVGGKPDYPSVFVSDGTTLLTLWQVADPQTATPFDRRATVGLHHLALKVADMETIETELMIADMESLVALHAKLSETDGVAMEFAPEPITAGATTHHFICAMPGGIRLEFATPF